MKLLVVHPDGTADLIDREHEVEVWQGIVGGWVQRIPVTAGCSVLADEDGRLKLYEVNLPATALASQLGWPGDFLVGEVIFVGDEGGNTFSDVPDDVVQVARRIDIEIQEDA